jgi:cytochrome c biogenesis protein CcdA
MRKLKSIAIVLASIVACFGLIGVAKAATITQFTFFYGQGCPHCAKVESYFQKEDIYNKYQVDKREVYFDQGNAAYFNQVMDEHGISTTERAVPTVVIGDRVVSGDESIMVYFDQLQKGDEQATSTPQKEAQKSQSKLSIPLIVGASIVDAINPCAFAVLLILLTTVLAKKGSKKSIVLSGLAFTASIFISYTLMGLGVYKALGSLQTTSTITTIVGIGAVILGLLNLKDWLWYGKYFKMEVPDSWRPRMKALIMSVTSPGGAFVVGLLVSLFLLPCSSGPYLVILGLLAESSLDARAIGYLLLYNLIFIVPMLIITGMVYSGANIQKLQQLREHNLRTLHLIAGIILLALGIFILL